MTAPFVNMVDDLRILVAKLEAERDEARNELAQALTRAECAEEELREVEKQAATKFAHISEITMGGGRDSHLAFGGEIVPLFARILADWFDACGGKNVVQSRIVDVRGKREFEFTMQLVGAKTPLELKAEVEAERDALRVERDKTEAALLRWCQDWRKEKAQMARFMELEMRNRGLWRAASDGGKA